MALLTRYTHYLRGRRLKSIIFVCLGIVILSLLSKALRSTSEIPRGYGQLSPENKFKRYAYATLLTSDNEAYFTATRVLTYQLLMDPETRTNLSIPFVVMVTTGVPKQQRAQLACDGATVVHVEDVPLPWWIRQRLLRPTRYGDQFTKLRVFQMTQYDRVLYIDADTMLMKSLDGVFNDEAVATPADTTAPRQGLFGGADNSLLPAQYVFAARPDNGRSNDGSTGGMFDHPVPPIERDHLSAGFWVAAPSNELFEYYLSIMTSTTTGLFRPFDPQTMEQAMFDYVHRRGGPIPWRSLDYRWSATCPNEKDIAAGIASLHEKFWSTGPQELQARWRAKRLETEALHDVSMDKCTR